MQKKSNLQNCTLTHIVKRSSTWNREKERGCVRRSSEALSEPVVVDVCFRTSSVQVIFALSSFSSSLSVSCSCSLGASSRVLSPSLVCVPSRSSSSVKMLRVLAPIIWSSTSLRCYCERMSIFLFNNNANRQNRVIALPKLSLSNHEPRAFVDFRWYESPSRWHVYPHADLKIPQTHTIRLRFICICALHSVQGQRVLGGSYQTDNDSIAARIAARARLWMLSTMF